MNPINIKVSKKEYDFFNNDPTITARFISNEIEFYLEGMYIKNKTFEIIFKFENQKIILKNSGNKIEIFQNGVLNFESDDLIKNYMIDVYKEIKKHYFDKDLSDNFNNSIELNKKQILNFK